MNPRPFWEAIYSDAEAPGAFGDPSDEIVELASILPPHARVLDLGAGDGRNSLFLAAAGHLVTAIDISPAAIAKLNGSAAREGLSITAEIRDLCAYRIEGEYELIIAHGCLHLLERQCRNQLVEQMKAHTAIDGYNVVAVFTDSIEPPDDLRPWTIGLFTEGEIFSAYSEWRVKERRSYVLEDEHPGGLRHTHAIDKLVAQRQN